MSCSMIRTAIPGGSFSRSCRILSVSAEGTPAAGFVEQQHLGPQAEPIAISTSRCLP